MDKKLEEQIVFTGVVEETRISDFRRLDRWHFTCERCQQRMRVKSGPADYDCPGCKTSYKVLADGRIFRVELSGAGGALAVKNINRNQLSPGNPSTKTGLLDRLTGAIKDANEEAHGKRLLDGLDSTNQAIRKLDGQIAERAIAGFLKRRSMLNAELPNWSNEGKIKMGKTLQDEARKKFDFNQAESYSLWLAGAWLESSARCSDSAASVYVFLERLARDIEC